MKHGIFGSVAVLNLKCHKDMLVRTLSIAREEFFANFKSSDSQATVLDSQSTQLEDSQEEDLPRCALTKVASFGLQTEFAQKWSATTV